MLVYLTINSILFFSLIHFQQDSVNTLTDKQNEYFISVPAQNSLVQNNDERNLKNKSSEKYSFSEFSFTFSSQKITASKIQQRLSLALTFGTVFTSHHNNHSLRSPPQI